MIAALNPTRATTITSQLTIFQTSDLSIQKSYTVHRRSRKSTLGEYEIEIAISQNQKVKAPLPDGLSVEFYTHCWSVVKNEFVNVLKKMYSSQTIDSRIKSGFIAQIHKKGPKPEISNYRPISLLNYDQKNFHQMLYQQIKTLSDIPFP